MEDAEKTTLRYFLDDEVGFDAAELYAVESPGRVDLMLRVTDGVAGVDLACDVVKDAKSKERMLSRLKKVRRLVNKAYAMVKDCEPEDAAE